MEEVQGTWLAQLIEHATLDLSSEFKPYVEGRVLLKKGGEGEGGTRPVEVTKPRCASVFYSTTHHLPEISRQPNKVPPNKVPL